MRADKKIAVVIPTLNEENAIGKVIADIPKWVDMIVISDNGSKDNTIKVAESLGAVTLQSKTGGGYGSACLAGIDRAEGHDVIVFVDGDFSDYPEQMDRLVDPILNGETDMVIGSRRLGNAKSGSLTPQQQFGNWLACFLIRLFWGVKYTDLGPFRAVEANSLKKLKMTDQAFGWTVQMQLHAIFEDIRVLEVPVDYRPRIGHSKISGTIRGTILAGHAIIGTILKSAMKKYLGRQQA
ncbi:MAG: glycosyltransferase family 2 protein [Pseudomonadota bacterium]